jgi:hypothetical protein
MNQTTSQPPSPEALCSALTILCHHWPDRIKPPVVARLIELGMLETAEGKLRVTYRGWTINRKLENGDAITDEDFASCRKYR